MRWHNRKKGRSQARAARRAPRREHARLALPGGSVAHQGCPRACLTFGSDVERKDRSKSLSMAWPDSVMSTFSGFRSRYTTPAGTSQGSQGTPLRTPIALHCGLAHAQERNGAYWRRYAPPHPRRVPTLLGCGGTRGTGALTLGVEELEGQEHFRGIELGHGLREALALLLLQHSVQLSARAELRDQAHVRRRLPQDRTSSTHPRRNKLRGPQHASAQDGSCQTPWAYHGTVQSGATSARACGTQRAGCASTGCCAYLEGGVECRQEGVVQAAQDVTLCASAVHLHSTRDSPAAQGRNPRERGRRDAHCSDGRISRDLCQGCTRPQEGHPPRLHEAGGVPGRGD